MSAPPVEEKAKEPLNKWTRADCEEICVRKGAKAQDQERRQARAYPLRVILTDFKLLQNPEPAMLAKPL